MGLKFKEGKLPKDHEERLKYLYKFQEQLRLYHNSKGKDVKDGKLTIKKFREFQQGWFKKYNLLICQEINKCKATLTDEEREKLLDYDEDSKEYNGAVKDKYKYKVDENTKTSIDDIEET